MVLRGNGMGSLKEYDITYNSVDITEDGKIDYEAISKAMKPNTKMVAIQRSKGYAADLLLPLMKLKKSFDL